MKPIFDKFWFIPVISDSAQICDGCNRGVPNIPAGTPHLERQCQWKSRYCVDCVGGSATPSNDELIYIFGDAS